MSTGGDLGGQCLLDVAGRVFLLDRGFTTLDVEELARICCAVVRIGATREFGCRGGFAANLLSIGGVVILSDIVALKELFLSAVC